MNATDQRAYGAQFFRDLPEHIKYRFQFGGDQLDWAGWCHLAVTDEMREGLLEAAVEWAAADPYVSSRRSKTATNTGGYR